MDRDHALDLKLYVLREYYRIKQNTSGEEMLALLHFITSEYLVDRDMALAIVLRLLKGTKNPVDFVKALETEL